ncbi:hypothetical protein, partial [Planktothrix sp.]|uniref:hypothetical protein n=1 Tax=Planktothrix sp. TaxID=3088171 RepID=UPI0038D358CD
GKLRFINDTFYTAIVFLYQPNNQQRPYRFIHIPPCKGREFLATYSNFWKVSFNEHKVYSVDQVSIKKGNFFEIKTSNLTGEQKWNNSCKNPVLITPVNRERFKDSTALIKDYENEEIDNLNYNGVLDLAK